MLVEAITQPFGPQPWLAGGGGSSGGTGQAGQAGGPSSLANTNIAAPGGSGGPAGSGTGGSNNITPSPTAFNMKGNLFFDRNVGIGGPNPFGSTGEDGFLLIYENIAS